MEHIHNAPGSPSSKSEDPDIKLEFDPPVPFNLDPPRAPSLLKEGNFALHCRFAATNGSNRSGPIVEEGDFDDVGISRAGRRPI